MTATQDSYLPIREPTDVILVERLLRAAPGTRSLGEITEAINRARDDLAGVPPGAMPELLERLVRQRLA